MKKAEIEQRFGAAMRFVKTLHGRGFQARISEAVGMQSSNLSEIVTKDKGTFEETRRAIFEECARLTPQLEGVPYDSFLYLGQLLLSGVPGEQALEEARRTHWATGNVTLSGMQTRAKGHVTPPVANVEPSAPDVRDAPLPGFLPVRKAATKLSAGAGALVYDDGFQGVFYFRADWLSKRCAPNDAVLFDVEGASMEPTVAEGGIVLVNTGIDADEWQDNKIYALRIGDSVRLKRLRPSPRDHRIQVVSDNPDYDNELFEPEELHIIGQVFWHAKEL